MEKKGKTDNALTCVNVGRSHALLMDGGWVTSVS